MANVKYRSIFTTRIVFYGQLFLRLSVKVYQFLRLKAKFYGPFSAIDWFHRDLLITEYL